MACAIECSEPQSEMFMARPPMRLAHIISLRASGSDPSRTARTSAPPASRVPSSPIASPTGVRAVTTSAAIACASASIPV